MTRFELAQTVAIERVAYERRCRAHGERPVPMDVAYCIDVVKQLVAAGTAIAGVRYDHVSRCFDLHLCWSKLVKRVERQLPQWRETAARVALEITVAALPEIDDDTFGLCQVCETSVVDLQMKGADGLSVCDGCRDESDENVEARGWAA